MESSIKNEASESTSDPYLLKKLEPEESKGIADLLSFYGSEVTSHAGMLIGFVVAFLAILQVRFSPDFADSPRVLIDSLLFVVITFGIYSVMRIVLYGKLAGILLHAGVSAYRKAIMARQDLPDPERTPLVNAATFAEYHLKTDTLKNNPFRRALIEGRARVIVSAVLALFLLLVLTILGV